MAFDFKKEYKEFYLPKNKPNIINVPKMNYRIKEIDKDDLFKIVLEKIEAMKAENIPEEKLEELIKNCNEKDASKVINLLQTLAVEASSSLIVKGILMMFGIPS